MEQQYTLNKVHLGQQKAPVAQPCKELSKGLQTTPGPASSVLACSLRSGRSESAGRSAPHYRYIHRLHHDPLAAAPGFHLPQTLSDAAFRQLLSLGSSSGLTLSQAAQLSYTTLWLPSTLVCPARGLQRSVSISLHHHSSGEFTGPLSRLSAARGSGGRDLLHLHTLHPSPGRDQSPPSSHRQAMAQAWDRPSLPK